MEGNVIEAYGRQVPLVGCHDLRDIVGLVMHDHGEQVVAGVAPEPPVLARLVEEAGDRSCHACTASLDSKRGELPRALGGDAFRRDQFIYTTTVRFLVMPALRGRQFKYA